MNNVIMANIDGGFEKLAFEINEIERIVPRYSANLVISNNEPDLMLELNGRTFSVNGRIDRETVRPFFILLESGMVYNAIDYQLLFNVQELPGDIISGINITGEKHLCKIHKSCKNSKADYKANLLLFKGHGESVEFSSEDAEQLKEVIQKMKKNEFFELLTMELSDKLKGVARELIEFRKDIQSKIEPDIVAIAARDIPEASNQLECINETLEESTMKIMDINEEQTEIAGGRLKILKSLLKEKVRGDEVDLSLEDAVKVIKEQVNVLRMIEERSLKMMEPLSFQDLVGQRIQRIIKLVRSMENRIEELIISFGIKLKRHKEDPARSYEELSKDVNKYLIELKGPQRTGEGLNQEAIDNILENI
jgi:chemotaxis protein CheZ